MPRFALQKRSLHALEMIEGFAKPHTALDELGLGLVEQQVCELAVAAKNLGHVRFIGELRVHLCPVMSRANEGEIGHEELERGVANRRADSCAGVGAVARRQEHDRQRVEEIGLALRARLRQPTAKRHTLEALEDIRERRALGEGPPQHLDHLLDGLESRVGVSGRPALADEKADVADDAVADLAESREMDEEPLLEQRRQRAVQVRRLGKLPELLDQPRRRVSGTEEIGEDAEAFGDLAPETKSARLPGVDASVTQCLIRAAAMAMNSWSIEHLRIS